MLQHVLHLGGYLGVVEGVYRQIMSVIFVNFNVNVTVVNYFSKSQI